MPHDYRRVLEAQARMREQGLARGRGRDGGLRGERPQPRPGGRELTMGKLTGFLEFRRESPHGRAPGGAGEGLGRVAAPRPDEQLLPRRARAAWTAARRSARRARSSTGWPPAARSTTSSPTGTTWSTAGCGAKRAIRLHQTNNFPEFTGRVCPAPCEGSCTLGINDDAGHDQDDRVRHRRPRVRRRLDLAGAAGDAHRQEESPSSAPARPASPAAAQLNRAGHTVTVIERADRIGGLLMYGIPNMKLDKRLVERRVRLMADAGVRFVTGVEVGRDIPSERLLADYDAVVLCCGATAGARPPRRGPRTLAGIHLAMEFLHANTKSLLDSNHADGQFISAPGQARRRHRRRRHRHRLRRHGAAARGRERRPARDPARPPDRAGARQPVAAVAEDLPARLRAGGGGRAAGRRPARLLGPDEALRRRRRGPRPRAPHGRASSGGRDPTGGWCSTRSRGPSASSPPTSSCSRSVSSGPEKNGPRPRTRAQARRPRQRRHRRARR